MGVNKIDVALFKKMVMNGAINLKNNHKEVDELNVFPVPDGDTGTNMSMTIMSGVTEMSNCESSSIIDVAKVLSRGALMGARGNSGVILSQFFRGLFVGLKTIDHDYLTVAEFMACLESGRQIAYKAVMEPVEGTILTVIREATEATRASFDSFNSINELLDFFIVEAHKSLDNTPNILPVLKEAGVVDSGGAGFLKIMEGMQLALNGKILELEGEEAKTADKPAADAEMKFNYLTEYTIDLKKPDTFDEAAFKSSLSLLGDQVEVVRDERIVKVHFHTNRPGKAIDLAQKLGELYNLNVENQKPRKEEPVEVAKKPRKPFALISVCFGDGIVSTFKEMGVDYVIEGGQTMNPSTESFVSAIKEVNADNVIIIPNNGNVVMAAKQAASMVRGSKVAVVPAKTIAQGYTSLMYFDPEADLNTNVASMTDGIKSVVSGEITYSIRDTEIGGVKINANDYMGIVDGEIIYSTKDRADVLKHLLENKITDETQIITFFYGKDVAEEEVSSLEEICNAINPDADIEIINGKQDIYSFIIAIE